MRINYWNELEDTKHEDVTWFIWLKTGKMYALMNRRFQMFREMSSLAVELLASQEKSCYTENCLLHWYELLEVSLM